MTSRDPQRCCEAVRSAILATAWLLVVKADEFYQIIKMILHCSALFHILISLVNLKILMLDLVSPRVSVRPIVIALKLQMWSLSSALPVKDVELGDKKLSVYRWLQTLYSLFYEVRMSKDGNYTTKIMHTCTSHFQHDCIPDGKQAYSLEFHSFSHCWLYSLEIFWNILSKQCCTVDTERGRNAATGVKLALMVSLLV